MLPCVCLFVCLLRCTGFVRSARARTHTALGGQVVHRFLLRRPVSLRGQASQRERGARARRRRSLPEVFDGRYVQISIFCISSQLTECSPPPLLPPWCARTNEIESLQTRSPCDGSSDSPSAAMPLHSGLRHPAAKNQTPCLIHLLAPVWQSFSPYGALVASAPARASRCAAVPARRALAAQEGTAFFLWCAAHCAHAWLRTSPYHVRQCSDAARLLPPPPAASRCRSSRSRAASSSPRRSAPRRSSPLRLRTRR